MRTSVTLFEMSDKAAKEHGINPKDRHHYVRMDDAKTNLFLKKPGATWYKRTEVLVGGLGGQKIGVLAPVTLLSGQTDEGLLNVLAEAVAGLGPGEHKLAAVIGEVGLALRGAFGDARNRARTIKDLFAGATTVETDRGPMHLRVVDSIGTFLRLEATSSEAFFQ
jgi:hypothetical protein